MAENMEADTFILMAHLLGKASGMTDEQVDEVLVVFALVERNINAVALKNKKDGFYAGAVRKMCHEDCPSFGHCDLDHAGEGFEILEQTAFIFDTVEEAEDYARLMKNKIRGDFLRDIEQEMRKNVAP